jgi:hypothetical protein
MLIRLEALELAANVGDSDASDRYGLNYIQARPDGSVVATDGTQLLRIQAKAEEPTLFDAELPEDERGFEGEVLIEAGEAKDFKSACRKALKRLGKAHEPTHVVIARDGDDLTMATADGIVTRRFTIRQPDAPNFPAVDRLLADTSERREIILSVDLLIKMLRTLRRLDVKCVRLGLSEEANSAIYLRAESKTGVIDGALMPMHDKTTVSADDAKPFDDHSAEIVDTSTGEVLAEWNGGAGEATH